MRNFYCPKLIGLLYPPNEPANLVRNCGDARRKPDLAPRISLVVRELLPLLRLPKWRRAELNFRFRVKLGKRDWVGEQGAFETSFIRVCVVAHFHTSHIGVSAGHDPVKHPRRKFQGLASQVSDFLVREGATG